MTILRANIVNMGDHSELVLETDEGVAGVPPQAPLCLWYGFAILTGPDVLAGKIQTTTAGVPQNPSVGRWAPMEWDQVTQDPVVVELARRFHAGELPMEGPVIVPDWESIDKSRWDFRGGQLVRVA